MAALSEPRVPHSPDFQSRMAIRYPDPVPYIPSGLEPSGGDAVIPFEPESTDKRKPDADRPTLPEAGIAGKTQTSPD